MGKKRINIILDDGYGWILKEIAVQIEKYQNQSDYEIILSHYRDKPEKFDLTHYMAWYLFKEDPYKTLRNPFIMSIHHISFWSEDFDQIRKQAKGFITLSKEWRTFLRFRKGILFKKIGVIPLGVDLNLFQLSNQKRDEEFVIGFVGINYEGLNRKGEKTFVDIIDLLKDEKFKLIVIGRGWEKELRHFKSLGIKVDSYTDLGSQDVARKFREFDILLCSSNIEGGPATLLEAWASGVTPVMTPVGMVKDFVHDGRNGFIFPKDSPENGAQIIKELIHTPEKLLDKNRLRNEAMNFSWEKQVRHYYDFYGQILNK